MWNLFEVQHFPKFLLGLREPHLLERQCFLDLCLACYIWHHPEGATFERKISWCFLDFLVTLTKFRKPELDCIYYIVSVWLKRMYYMRLFFLINIMTHTKTTSGIANVPSIFLFTGIVFPKFSKYFLLSIHMASQQFTKTFFHAALSNLTLKQSKFWMILLK